MEPSFAPTRSGEQRKGVFGSKESLNNLAYAFRVLGTVESIIPAHSSGLNVPMMFINNRNQYLKNLSRVGSIIEMPEQYFLPEPDRDGRVFEYISPKAIPLSECKIKKINFEDALKQGLQIFFIKIKNEADIERMRGKLIALSNLEDLGKMINSGDLEYYNQELSHKGLKVSLIDFDNKQIMFS